MDSQGTGSSNVQEDTNLQTGGIHKEADRNRWCVSFFFSGGGMFLSGPNVFIEAGRGAKAVFE